MRLLLITIIFFCSFPAWGSSPRVGTQKYKLLQCKRVYPNAASEEYRICKGIIETVGSVYYWTPRGKRQRHVTVKLVQILIQEGKRILAKPENSWLTLQQLLGIATVESDMRWWLQHWNGWGVDCGITQNRVSEPTVMPKCDIEESKKKWACWRRECNKVTVYSTPRKSIRKSFKLALLELNHIRNRWCCVIGDKRRNSRGRQICRGRYWKTGTDQMRCILSVYNQGPKYSINWRWRTCQPRRRAKDTDASLRRRRLRCVFVTRYYLHALCFAKGYELGRGAKYNCRKAKSIYWINRTYSIPSSSPYRLRG